VPALPEVFLFHHNYSAFPNVVVAGLVGHEDASQAPSFGAHFVSKVAVQTVVVVVAVVVVVVATLYVVVGVVLP
jgi:hypothetical protein